jgi:hypothetical protein
MDSHTTAGDQKTHQTLAVWIATCHKALLGYPYFMQASASTPPAIAELDLCTLALSDINGPA